MDSANIQYADARDWQDIMKNRSRLKMHELIERLGLRAKWSSNKRGKTNFDSHLVKNLVVEMTNVVSTLPKETDELIALLAQPQSLKTQVDGLLQKHGSGIWGRVGDREHLVSVGEPEVESFYYPRDLYFENEEDRELIRMLLHWWIGLKACNVILARDRLERERRKKEERLRVRDDEASPRESNPHVAIAPANHPGLKHESSFEDRRSATPSSFAHPPRHAQLSRLDTSFGQTISLRSASTPLSGGSSIYSVHGAGHSASVHSTERDLGGSRRPSTLSQSIQSHANVDVSNACRMGIAPIPSLQQLGSELDRLVSNFLVENSASANANVHAHASFTPRQSGLRQEEPSKQPNRRGLEPEVLGAFRSYIYPEETGARWDENLLLRTLETAWRDDVRAHNRSLGDTSLFVARDRAFLTWIELRRHLADLERADKRWRQETTLTQEIEARIAQHKTLMSASRDLIRNWEDIGPGVTLPQTPESFTADDLLMQAFVLLAGESAKDMMWSPMNVRETITWLRGQLEQFREEAEGDECLLYLRA